MQSTAITTLRYGVFILVHFPVNQACIQKAAMLIQQSGYIVSAC